ncbi:DUF6984 family protein [Neoaquamicrobium sediminum]|uniref:DUF6984 family protein n=1 Tax=Neoaquamicrobium sediminum TaxID=1849104 RepID=UPI003BAB1BC6
MALALPLNELSLCEARRALLDHVTDQRGLAPSGSSDFEPMSDGNMGSFRILSAVDSGDPEQVIAEFEFLDADGVGVLVTAFSREGRTISSFDFWRYDFGSLQSFPEPADLHAPRRT